MSQWRTLKIVDKLCLAGQALLCYKVTGQQLVSPNQVDDYNFFH